MATLAEPSIQLGAGLLKARSRSFSRSTISRLPTTPDQTEVNMRTRVNRLKSAAKALLSPNHVQRLKACRAQNVFLPLWREPEQVRQVPIRLLLRRLDTLPPAVHPPRRPGAGAAVRAAHGLAWLAAADRLARLVADGWERRRVLGVAALQQVVTLRHHLPATMLLLPEPSQGRKSRPAVRKRWMSLTCAIRSSSAWVLLSTPVLLSPARSSLGASVSLT